MGIVEIWVRHLPVFLKCFIFDQFFFTNLSGNTFDSKLGCVGPLVCYLCIGVQMCSRTVDMLTNRTMHTD